MNELMIHFLAWMQHRFHVECIDQWVSRRRPVCPICKASARPGGQSVSELRTRSRMLRGLVGGRWLAYRSSIGAFNTQGEPAAQPPQEGTGESARLFPGEDAAAGPTLQSVQVPQLDAEATSNARPRMDAARGEVSEIESAQDTPQRAGT